MVRYFGYTRVSSRFQERMKWALRTEMVNCPRERWHSHSSFGQEYVRRGFYSEWFLLLLVVARNVVILQSADGRIIPAGITHGHWCMYWMIFKRRGLKLGGRRSTVTLFNSRIAQHKKYIFKQNETFQKQIKWMVITKLTWNKSHELVFPYESCKVLLWVITWKWVINYC